MILRADHISGGAFVAFGLGIIALSGDLPMGSLSFPGSGFLPKILAVLLAVFGLVLVLRAGEGETFASIEWSDLRHAGPVIAFTAAGIALYTVLGFLITVALLLFSLIVFIERKNVLAAGIYSIAVTALAYALFERLLKTPLPHGPFGF
jgi:putative tricarboxylic transport membrane protein